MQPRTPHRIAFLAADGAERVEATRPREPLDAAGVPVELVSPRLGEIRVFDHLDFAGTLPVDRSLRDADPERYGGLVLPGGVAGANHLRRDPAAVGLIRSCVDAAKPIAAFSYALWLLIEADAIRGHVVTGPPSIQTDILNAGGSWVSEAAHVDRALLTCRGPSDVERCCGWLVPHLLDRARRATIPVGQAPPPTARVADAMRPGVIYCPPDASVKTLARVMTTNHIHSVLITAGGEAPVGIVSEHELVRATRPNGTERTAGSVAADPVTVFVDDPLTRATELMTERRVTHLVVVDAAGRPIGVLSASDVAAAIARGRV